MHGLPNNVLLFTLGCNHVVGVLAGGSLLIAILQWRGRGKLENYLHTHSNIASFCAPALSRDEKYVLRSEYDVLKAKYDLLENLNQSLIATPGHPNFQAGYGDAISRLETRVRKLEEPSTSMSSTPLSLLQQRSQSSPGPLSGATYFFSPTPPSPSPPVGMY
jgi:hypothetical protein